MLVAELPLFSNEAFDFLPGFFLGGAAATGAATPEELTVMLEFCCEEASFATCADGDPGLDCGGEESSAELDREWSTAADS